MVKDGRREVAGFIRHTIYEPAMQSFMSMLVGISILWISVYIFVRSGLVSGLMMWMIVAGMLTGGIRLIWSVMYFVANGRSMPERVLKNTDLRGKLCIVTGANCGLGLASCKQLVRWGATVIMGCRSEEKAKNAIKEIKREILINPGKFGTSGKMEFESLDLSDFVSIRAFANRIDSRPIHCIMCNAGIVASNNWCTTKQGHELTFGTNHLGHFLLIKLLWENILKNNTRIVNVSSIAHINSFGRKSIEIDIFDEKSSKKSYSSFKYYTISKLCNILFTNELQLRLEDEGWRNVVVSLHPGSVQTDIIRNMVTDIKNAQGMVKKIMAGIKVPAAMILQSPICRTAESGANTQLYLVGEKTENLTPAGYYMECKLFPVAKPGANVETQRLLWDYSDRLTMSD